SKNALVGSRSGGCRHHVQSRSIQPLPSDRHLFWRLQRGRVGDHWQLGAFLFLCELAYPFGAAATLEITAGSACCSRSHCAQQLSPSVDSLYNHLLQLRATAVWQGRASGWFSTDNCDLFDSGPTEHMVATIFPVWSYGMGVAVPDLRTTTTN